MWWMIKNLLAWLDTTQSVKIFVEQLCIWDRSQVIKMLLGCSRLGILLLVFDHSFSVCRLRERGYIYIYIKQNVHVGVSWLRVREIQLIIVLSSVLTCKIKWRLSFPAGMNKAFCYCYCYFSHSPCYRKASRLWWSGSIHVQDQNQPTKCY